MISIKGEKHILWRAVDQDGFVLEVVVQKRRHTSDANRFIRKLLSVQGCSPRVVVTDKLGSYGAANRKIGLSVWDHRQHKVFLNSRGKNLHQPVGRREGIMKRFKSARHLQSSLPFTTLLTTCITSQETNSVPPITVNYAMPQQTCGVKLPAYRSSQILFATQAKR